MPLLSCLFSRPAVRPKKWNRGSNFLVRQAFSFHETTRESRGVPD